MTTATQESRKGLIAVLVFSGFFLGIIAGGFISAKFLVDKSDGLAGGVMVLFYALVFAVLLAAAGGVAGKMLPRKRARRLAWIITPVAVSIMLLLGWRVAVETGNQNAARVEGYASLLPYEITVADFKKIKSFSYVYVDDVASVRINDRVCTGPLPGPSRLALLSALRGVEGRTIRCGDCDDESTRVQWQIQEALGNISSSQFQVSQKLLSNDPGVKNLLESVVEASGEIKCK